MGHSFTLWWYTEVAWSRKIEWFKEAWVRTIGCMFQGTEQSGSVIGYG